VARRRQGPGKHSIHYELVEAMRREGCPACRLAATAVARYLDDLIYEHVNEIELRDTLRTAGGFCNEHSWQLKHMRAAFGTAIIYRDVLNNLGRRLRAHQQGTRLALYGTAGKADGRLMERLASLAGGTPSPASNGTADPHVACPACRVRLDREVLVLRALLEGMADGEFAAEYRAAAGLCLVHVEQASTVAVGEGGGLEAGMALVVEHALTRIAATLGELDEFVRKHDYRFRDETIGAEGTAWLHAIEMIAGKEGIR
jgi:hypothetical protein